MADREVDPRIAQVGEEPELVGVVRGRDGEGLEVGGEQVVAGAAGTPGGEAGGDGVVLLEVLDGVPEDGRVGPVHEDARVGGLELVPDGLAAAWHAGNGRGWEGGFHAFLFANDGQA